jgi:hypothetical protein
VVKIVLAFPPEVPLLPSAGFYGGGVYCCLEPNRTPQNSSILTPCRRTVTRTRPLSLSPLSLSGGTIYFGATHRATAIRRDFGNRKN